MGDNQVLNVVMSSASLVISLALLLIHLKNRKTQLRAYFLSRETYRSSIVVLDYVASEQLDENVLLKLVLFSPGSVATVIRSLTLYRKCESRFFLLRAFGITEWRKVREATWGPVSDPNCKNILQTNTVAFTSTLIVTYTFYFLDLSTEMSISSRSRPTTVVALRSPP